jgi:serine/threonine protein kinase
VAAVAHDRPGCVFYRGGGSAAFLPPPRTTVVLQVQEYMELGPVMMEKERNAPLDPAVARGYFRDILAGVHYLHFQGVIHR